MQRTANHVQQVLKETGEGAKDQITKGFVYSTKGTKVSIIKTWSGRWEVTLLLDAQFSWNSTIQALPQVLGEKIVWESHLASVAMSYPLSPRLSPRKPVMVKLKGLEDKGSRCLQKVLWICSSQVQKGHRGLGALSEMSFISEVLEEENGFWVTPVLRVYSRLYSGITPGYAKGLTRCKRTMSVTYSQCPTCCTMLST